MRKETSLTLFRAIAWFVAIYHAILGLIGIFGSPGVLSQVIAWTYRLHPKLDPQFLLLVRFTGSYLLALGIMMMMVARNPREYSVFIWPTVAMFATRLIDITMNFSGIQTAFGAGPIDVLITVGLIVFFGGTLIVFKPRE